MAGVGGKTEGAGRKSAPEPLKAVTFRVPESLALWLRQNCSNQSKFISDAIAIAKAKTETETETETES